MEATQPVQINIYQINTHRKGLGRLYFKNEPKTKDSRQAEGIGPNSCPY